MNGISFGHYIEGHSLLHRLDPRFKLLIVVFYIIELFVASNIFSFVLLAVLTVAATLISGIDLKLLARSMRSLLIIILITSAINIFWLKGDHLLVSFGFIKIYAEGLINAGIIVLRIAMLLCGSSVFLTYTTTPIALTDGLEQLLSPLKRIKIPVHEFSMMMTIALRFIPTLIEETEKIMNAQKARGADFSSGSIINRAKALVPILIPLFVSAFRRADELATAMESRCYTGGEGRTRMNVLHSAPRDWLALITIVLIGAAVILMNIYMPGYSLSW